MARVSRNKQTQKQKRKQKKVGMGPKLECVQSRCLEASSEGWWRKGNAIVYKLLGSMLALRSHGIMHAHL